MACCPVQDHGEASLWIAVAVGGRILLRCRTGCSNAAVMEALDLTMADLVLPSVHVRVPEKTPSPTGQRSTPPPAARTPPGPQDATLGIDATHSMLGAMLINPQAANAVFDMIDDSDFYYDSHRIIFRTLRAMRADGEPIDQVTLSSRLQRAGLLEKAGGKAAIHTLPELCPTAVNVRQYAETVRETANLRALTRIGQELLADVSGNGHSAAALVERHQDRLRGLAERTASTDGKRFVLRDPRKATPSRPVALIPGRVFRSSLTVVGGRQGDGKGKVLRDLAARATRGGPWPFGSAELFEPLTWLDLNAEDDFEEVIVPEYIAAGANLERLKVVNSRQDGLFPNLADPAQRRQLEELIGDLHVDVVSIDPVSHFFPGVKINEAESVIASLSPLMQIAKRTKTAIIPVTHFGKAMTADALSKFLGSGQWTAVARSALGVVLDPGNEDEDRERRQLWSVKCNIARRRDRLPWGFEIVENADHRAVIAWDANATTTSEAAAFNLEGRRKSPDSKEAKARAWLTEFLADGKMWRSTVLCEKAAPEGHPGWAITKALKNNTEFVQKPVGLGYKQGTCVEWGLASALQ